MMSYKSRNHSPRHTVAHNQLSNIYILITLRYRLELIGMLASSMVILPLLHKLSTCGWEDRSPVSAEGPG